MPQPRPSSRRVLAAAAALVLAAAPASLSAQGWIVIPGPCEDCAPPRCAPVERCRPWDAQVRRVSSDVRVSLRERVLSYEVTEIFHNAGGRIGEADYLFPLPRDAAFQDLQLEIDGELVSGETLGAGEARRIYEEIVRRQKDPALVEWMGHGLLRTRIFPIAPGERKKVVVRFQMVAEREGDAVRVDYFRGSRFDEAALGTRRPGLGSPRPPAERRAPSAEGRVAFHLTIPRDAPYGDPYSPTHELEIDDDRSSRKVSVRGNAREVLILLPLRRQREASVAVLTHAARAGTGFTLIRLTPPASHARTMPRDVTLVLDVSGSMRGRKLEQAKAAGRQLLATLDARDRFRLVRFSTDVESFRDGFVTATRASVRDAERWLDDLEAEGSTNISGALEEALDGDVAAERRAPSAEGRPHDRLELVLFLTDGAPTVGERDPAAIAELARRERGERRLFTFGVGADVNTALVEQLALEGRGTAHFVRPDEDVERAVGIVAARLRGPIATDLRLRADGVRLEQVMPNAPADLFAGEDLVVLARYQTRDDVSAARIRFEGRSPDGAVRWETTARFPQLERDNAFIPRLWATRRVGWLSAERRRSGPNEEIDGEIRRLGETYGIPTELTSYLVLEPGMDDMRRRDVAGRVGGAVTRGSQRQAMGEQPMQLEAIVTTGAASASAPTRNESDFAAAKAAAEQRAASSVAAVDSVALEAVGGAPGESRRVGDRIFRLANGRWTDARYTSGMTVRAVRPYSAAYFDLLRAIPELAEIFALGDQVLAAGGSIAIEVASTGAESLSRAELERIEREWRGR
ncbi:MAG TPA: VIT domain-containing protein [Gemmatimonadaceae bacterium]